MKKRHLVLCATVLFALPMIGFCDLIEEEPMFPDNTAPLGTGDNSADIVNAEESEVSGKQNGEITIFKTDSGVEVFSGFNKVEVIPTGSDGWVGRVDVQTTKILFEPMGRPELDCPSQDIANWYGPCKVPEVTE